MNGQDHKADVKGKLNHPCKEMAPHQNIYEGGANYRLIFIDSFYTLSQCGRSSNKTKQWLHKVMNALSGTTQSQADVVNRKNKPLKCHSTPALPKAVETRPGNSLG